MPKNIYIFLMSLVERSKHKGENSPYKLVRAFRYYKYLMLSVFANWLIKCVALPTMTSNGQNKTKIIASLTTFPSRIRQVRYAIKSIMMQTVRPDKVILWLAREQFSSETIPDNLKDLCDYGLEIRFCEDLRSHKKYYYALQQQKADEIVITFDDDIIYHPHSIERLIEKHNEYPNSIICNQVHVITWDENDNIKPYNQWNHYKKGISNPNVDFMPLTGSGCLYPYNTMPEITFDKKTLKGCAFTADDLWIGYIARLSGRSICLVDKPANLFSVVKSSQAQHLGQINCLGDGNDQTIKKLIEVFPDIHRSKHQNHS